MFQHPFKLGKNLNWIFGWGGYPWPMYVLYAAVACLTFRYLQPSLDTTKTLAIGWIAYMLVRNTG